MMKKNFFVLLLAIVFLFGCTQLSQNSTANNTSSDARKSASIQEPQPWDFDPGPDPNSKMGKELIDLVARQPFMPGISVEISVRQTFRPTYGPTLWRMIQEPNSIKILFIGQDGTHIAEAAGRTATAGFGGRAQDVAEHFGVKTGAAFINTFAFTISKQYGAFGTPIFTTLGKPRVNFGTVTENEMWMMAQDQNSPMVKWRNDLIDWIIRNNRDSLKLVVLFGGSAQDSLATFIESKGGKVGTKFSEDEILSAGVKIPDFRLESAGSNMTFPVLVDQKGNDLYSQLAGRQLNYKPKKDEKKSEDQALAQKLLKENLANVFDKIKFSKAGLHGSGIIHPAQIEGYDLKKVSANEDDFKNRKFTISMQGLSLSDGSKIKDLLFIESPHPTRLSTMSDEAASAKVEEAIKKLRPFAENGWRIEADSGMENKFDKRIPYRYGRADIEPIYYDFGTPKNRMVNVSTADRDRAAGFDYIVLGARKGAEFNQKQLTAARKVRRPEGIENTEMFTARPRSQNTRYVFDRGPSESIARVMKQNINLKNANLAKNIKSNPKDVGDFGHYRGTFQNPKVIILADPDGYDDILTSRALTGTRGQFLQGMMNDLGVNDQYLVIKTVPFGMDEATEENWAAVMKETKKYRDEIFKTLSQTTNPDFFIADGKFAASEIDGLIFKNKPVVKISREGSDNNSGILKSALEINKIKGYESKKIFALMSIIPRSHLGFFSRVWEGTSGTRVFNSSNTAMKGTAFAIVVPEWTRTAPIQSDAEKKAVSNMKNTLEKSGLLKTKGTSNNNNKKDNADEEDIETDEVPSAFFNLNSFYELLAA